MFPESPVRLRRLMKVDLPQIHGWYQRPELWDHLVGEFTPRSEAEALAYMQGWLEPSEREVRLAVEDGGGRLLGLASLAPIDRARGQAELHVFLGEPAERGRGAGRAAVAALLTHGFVALDLQRISLKVLASNAAARRVYGRSGFKPTGAPRETVRKSGREVEVLEMAIDRRDWARLAQAQAGYTTTEMLAQKVGCSRPS